MHCPQCGQQQVSEEVRFCKGCGFALSAVKELPVTGGISPTEIEGSKPRLSPKRRGVRQSAILLFIAVCLLPLSTVIGDRWGEIIPLMFVTAGLMRMLYTAIFRKALLWKEVNLLPFLQQLSTRLTELEQGLMTERYLQREAYL